MSQVHNQPLYSQNREYIYRPDYYRLMMITDFSGFCKRNYGRLLIEEAQKAIAEYSDLVESCVEAGVTAVQLREKNLDKRVLEQLGQSLCQRPSPERSSDRALFIVNDSAALAHRLSAGGVHLGKEDGDLQEARTILGKERIIGLSVDCAEDVKKANHLPIDYIGAGAVFATSNKPDADDLGGPAGLVPIVRESRKPVIAIGGISVERAAEVMESGVDGMAVIGAISAASDPVRAAGELRQIIDDFPVRCLGRSL